MHQKQQDESHERAFEQLEEEQSPGSTHLARHCVDYFQNYVCTHFAPYRQFFQLQHCAQIIASTPHFKPTISNSLRDNLKIQRQIQYLKAALRQPHIYSTIEQQLVQEVPYQPLKRQGNTLLEHQGWVYWAHSCKLMCFQLGEAIRCQKIVEKKQRGQCISWEVSTSAATQLVDISQTILEIKRHINLMILRTARNLYLYDLQGYDILQTYAFPLEIVTFWTNKNYLFVSLSNTNQSIIQMIDLQTQQQTQSNYQIKDLHSGWNIHRSALVVCSYEDVHLVDLRAKQSQILRKCDSGCRIFGGISLGGQSFSQNLFISSESFQVKVFDLRSAGKAMTQMSHFCEQSPPTILSFFQKQQSPTQKLQSGSKNSKLQFLQHFNNSKKSDPIIIATHPYPFGNSLYAQIPENFSLINKIEQSNKFQSFNLLFDRGKLDRLYHPHAVTMVSLNDHYIFLHLDNFGGLFAQLFSRESLALKNSNQEKHLHRIEFSKQSGLQETISANESWLTRRRVQTYLKQEKNPENNDNNQQSMDLQLEMATFKQKYLRYADLKDFYYKVALSKQEIKFEDMILEDQRQVQTVINENTNQMSSIYQTLESTLADGRYAGRQNITISHSLLEDLDKAWEAGI